MPLVSETIEAQIGTLIDSTSILGPDEAKEAFKTQLSAIIVAAIQSATVTIPIGGVIVTGSAVTQTNPAIVIGALT